MQPTKQELHDLISGCLDNNRKCQQRIYEQFYGKMLGVCMRYANDLDSGKDLVQEGFIKLFANLHNYKSDGSFEGWVRRIFVNNAIDSFRRKKHRDIVPENDYQLMNLADETDEHAFLDEEEETIKPKDVIAAMQRLSPAYQMVFNLYVMENYSHQEIADELGISVGTSKSNLAKSRMNMRKILQEQFADRL
ncbi:MAG: sigma-70 family RNA polymerase sigma factor [Flavobacteriales bacterium]|nr:sigma-70 family RNA polymerase sigma factor [Flavobacteriales bacterium]